MYENINLTLRNIHNLNLRIEILQPTRPRKLKLFAIIKYCIDNTASDTLFTDISHSARAFYILKKKVIPLSTCISFS